MSNLISLLDRPIAYQACFVRFGGVTGAVLLSQLVYWHNRMDGSWFYKTQKEIKSETGLSREEQETARRRLISAGVLEEARRGVPAKLFFRVKADRLEALLLKSEEKPQSSMRESRNQESGDPANKNADMPQASLRESHSPACGKAAIIHTVDYQETTTEITTETVRQASPVQSPLDYQSVLAAYHQIIPEMPRVSELTNSRREKLRAFWRKFDFTQERWVAYLRYIAKNCRWMCENRADNASGRTWRKKNFDYLITERCYLAVKEERANDLPKAGGQRDITVVPSADYAIPHGFRGE
ncbi:MAG: replication protein [Pantoea sp.]|uniref:replication protein n=1 Tax=Pantoea sp. TaxID=69393 RepID=UPI002913F7B6|nr:replication protein [Pantoea sp.]MDU6388656.1 replication protein [Pantoea sp.]